MAVASNSNLSRSTRRRIPNFSLYGEQSAPVGDTDSLHIEDIPSRSRKYLWKIRTHRHTGPCQLVYVTAGSATVDLEESHSKFDGPIVIVIPAGTVHGFKFRSDTEGYVLTVHLDRLLSLASSAHRAPIAALFSEPRTLALGADRLLAARVARILATLLQEFRQPDSLLSPVSNWLACSALWALAAAKLESSTGLAVGHDLDRLRRFRSLIEAHYLLHWPVERYAARLSVSQSGLNRLCRSLTGATAFHIIQQRLALEARRRLVYVAGSIATHAAQLGFKDPAYFCRFFRKHCGVSPTVFRARHGGG